MISSIELIKRVGISRATLNNYISAGLLPRPTLKSPEDSTIDSSAPRVGFFPDEVVDTVLEIQHQKDRGFSMQEIQRQLSKEISQIDSVNTQSRFIRPSDIGQSTSGGSVQIGGSNVAYQQVWLLGLKIWGCHRARLTLNPEYYFEIYHHLIGIIERYQDKQALHLLESGQDYFQFLLVQQAEISTSCQQRLLTAVRGLYLDILDWVRFDTEYSKVPLSIAIDYDHDWVDLCKENRSPLRSSYLFNPDVNITSQMCRYSVANSQSIVISKEAFLQISADDFRSYGIKIASSDHCGGKSGVNFSAWDIEGVDMSRIKPLLGITGLNIIDDL